MVGEMSFEAAVLLCSKRIRRLEMLMILKVLKYVDKIFDG